MTTEKVSAVYCCLSALSTFHSVLTDNKCVFFLFHPPYGHATLAKGWGGGQSGRFMMANDTKEHRVRDEPPPHLAPHWCYTWSNRTSRCDIIPYWGKQKRWGFYENVFFLKVPKN